MNAHREMVPLRPVAPIDNTVARTFSKMRGAPHMKVGCTCLRLGTMRSMRPSTAEVKPMTS